jgi:hypothetical protein
MIYAIAVAAVASFLLSSVWYVTFGRVLPRLNPVYAHRAPAWTPVAELLRSAALGTAIAVFCAWAGVDGAADATRFALVAWAGFPVVLLSGSVLHERVPWRLAAIHAGDWLLKLVAVTLVVALWP